MTDLYECGCEYGESCTKTTMCAIQSALEDQREELDTALADNESLRRLAHEYIKAYEALAFPASTRREKK